MSIFEFSAPSRLQDMKFVGHGRRAPKTRKWTEIFVGHGRPAQGDRWLKMCTSACTVDMLFGAGNVLTSRPQFPLELGVQILAANVFLVVVARKKCSAHFIANYVDLPPRA